MRDEIAVVFDAAEQAILTAIDRRLRAEGWAKHATADSLLHDWLNLSISVDQYKFGVDDYTNDLCAREGLQLVIAECPEPLRTKLKSKIEDADKEFLARTLNDSEHVLEHYFRIDPSSAWWWHRIPATGPLADYLNAPIR